MIDFEEVRSQVGQALEGLLEVANLQPGQIFVLGCSSSEIMGGRIGKNSNMEVGRIVVSTILPVLKEKGVYLAVQGCEHINRALAIEEEAAIRHGLEIVTVIPAPHAGGSASVAAYSLMENPVMVERVVAHAGMDIGDTFIGMHLKHVAIPVRLPISSIGAAHLTLARSRPKLIGGERAIYRRETYVKYL